MKILWQNNSSEVITGGDKMEIIWNSLKKLYVKVSSPGTEIKLEHLSVSTNYVRSFYAEFYNNIGIIEKVLQAEEQGFDAVILGCMSDPGIWEAREAVDIPVVGVGESAYLIAQLLGIRFAVITVDEKIIPNMEKKLNLYGFSNRAISKPIRAVNVPFTTKEYIDGFKDPYKYIIPRFEEVAHECIKDGADVIIAGCGYVGPMFTLGGYTRIKGTEVPVVDGATAAIKLAETLVEMKRKVGVSKSKHSYFAPPPKSVIDNIRKTYK